MSAAGLSVAQSLRPLAAAAVAGSLAFAAPVLAQTAVDAEGRVFGNAMPAPPMPAMPPHAMPAAPMAHPGSYHAPAPGYDPAAWERAKGDWLAECRRRVGGSNSKTAGAVIGGLVGGVVGNRIAGKGDRTVGTIAGAAVGAVAGGAIGASADRNRARDYCEAYLEDSLAGYYGQGGYGPGYGYGYGYGYPQAGYAMQPVMMMVPVMYQAAPPAKTRECVETTVVEEWVPVKTRKRTIAPRPDKRVKIVPDKRVRAN